MLRSLSRLKPLEKREGEEDAGEILSCAFSLSLARHLTSPSKRQIPFRLLSRQSKLRYSLVSLSLLASFLRMQSCEGYFHTF